MPTGSTHKQRWGIEVWAFTEHGLETIQLLDLFDYKVWPITWTTFCWLRKSAVRSTAQRRRTCDTHCSAVVLTLVSVCPTLQPKIQADPMHDEGEREIHDEKWITWKRYHASQDENCRNLKRKATKQEWLSTAQWQCTETVKHRSNQVLGVRLSSCRQMTVNGN